MKFLVVLTVVVAYASADVSHVVGKDAAAQILRSESDISPEGGFKYAYETSNGIVGEAVGVVENANSDNAAIGVRGRVAYTSPEGVPVELTYVADANGYQPQGSHLPVPPPIPELIQRSLEYIAAHPPPPSQSAPARGSGGFFGGGSPFAVASLLG